MNVLVNGGAGYFRSVLIPRQMAAGHHARVHGSLKNCCNRHFIIFASTGSGALVDDRCAEENPLHSLASYCTTSIKTEQHLRQFDHVIGKGVATIFWSSSRVDPVLSIRVCQKNGAH
jgi:hypothetical protein